jgi:hypothetical protein
MLVSSGCGWLRVAAARAAGTAVPRALRGAALGGLRRGVTVRAVLAFLPSPEPTPPPGEAQPWRRWLFASAAAAALATGWPWVQVSFERLFGALLGPPGWRSSAGFTCLCTCLLVAMMALAETQARSTHQAARPASVLLVAVAAAALLFEWLDGPGTLRGVTAQWTWAFWVVASATGALLFACTRRALHVRPR